MSDNPFDRVIVNPREKPLSEDVNALQAQLDRAVRFFAKAMFSNSVGAPQSGFLAGGLKAVEAGTPAMSVVLKAGLGFQDDPTDVPTDIDGILGLDDVDSFKPLPLVSDLTITIPAAPAGPNDRTDIIEVRADRLTTNNISRDIFDNTSETFSPTLVNKTIEFLLDGTKQGSVVSPAASTAAISLKTGVAGNPGAVPATTSGYIKIAEVFVDSDVTTILDAAITDSRTVLQPFNVPLTIPGDLIVTGAIKHGTRELFIPGTGGQGFASGTGVWEKPNASSVTVWTAPAVGNQWNAPILLPVGKQIEEVTVYWKASGAGTKFFRVRSQTMAEVAATPFTVSSTSVLGTLETLVVTGSPLLIETDVAYSFEFTGISSEQIWGVKIEYTEP